MSNDWDWTAQRERMVQDDLKARGIQDVRVLAAMKAVPRHRFVLAEYAAHAYEDAPLPIDDDQTISQPYIVALMTEALRLQGSERILEIGTGSGYQTAVLAEMGAQVWTIEQSQKLASQSKRRLERLGYESIHFIHGDGTLGLAAQAPFDCILATGSLPEVPATLLQQLADGGIFVGPIGQWHCQELVRIVYHQTSFEPEVLCQCRFVPLIGEAGWQH